MFNYRFDDGGVYIGNLSNMAEKYGIGQYRFAHNYELAGKDFKISDGKATHTIRIKGDKLAELDGCECQYEALKLEATTYFVRLGFNIAVFDLSNGLITLIIGDDYFYGRIEGAAIPDGAAHTGAGGDMIDTSVAWYLGCGRYVWHEFSEEGKCRVRWSPKPNLKNDLPCTATRIKYPIFLVDIKGFAPFRTDAPALLDRSIFLQDYDHMLTVGCLFCSGEAPIMVSGYAKYMDGIATESQAAELNKGIPDMPGL